MPETAAAADPERLSNASSISDTAADDSKTLLGKYEMGKLLGCGAFAKVYHARNISTGQSVAIKVISKSRISNTSLMSNIKREVSIMRKLHNRHIIKLHEVSASKTKIYFVMEFAKGGELFTKVSRGRFTENLSRKYFQQLISAVGYCHSRGIFHRDLKPENLLLDENGDLKVSDFGLSAVADQIRSDGMLHTLCGTPAYVAPEVLRRKGYDGARVDVWSCGVILFVLTAGHLPFNDHNVMALYKKIYRGEYKCPKWMSSDLKRLLSRLLDTNPETRITIDGILKDPWFRKGGLIKPLNFKEEERVAVVNSKEESVMRELNAFDLISFSSGLDLSGLFDETFVPTEDGERILCLGSPEKLKERVHEFCGGEKLRTRRKKEWGFELEGQKGNLRISVDIFQLTDGLAVVEARRRGGDSKCYREMWQNKMKPMLQNASPPPREPEMLVVAAAA